VRFERSMAAVPWDADTRGELGALFAPRATRTTRPRPRFEEALRRDPTTSNALTGLGRPPLGPRAPRGRRRRSPSERSRWLPRIPSCASWPRISPKRKGDIARGIELRQKSAPVPCVSPVEHVGLAVRELQSRSRRRRTPNAAPKPRAPNASSTRVSCAALSGRIEVARDALRDRSHRRRGRRRFRARALLGDDTPDSRRRLLRWRRARDPRGRLVSTSPAVRTTGRLARPAETPTLLRIARARSIGSAVHSAARTARTPCRYDPSVPRRTFHYLAAALCFWALGTRGSSAVRTTTRFATSIEDVYRFVFPTGTPSGWSPSATTRWSPT
jgi:hypothetical protein